MNVITTFGIRRSPWRLLLAFIALCVLTCTQAVMAQSGLILTISKTNDAPNPVPSGQIFTYTIAYSWTGGIGWSVSTPGAVTIVDAVPSTLDVISAAPGSPVSTIVGNTVTFNLNNLTAPAGAGTVQINVRFKPGVTCPGTQACNIASISAKDAQTVRSNESCVRATASNKWIFQKTYVSGCIVDSGDVVYNIALINPSGNDIGGLNLTSISLDDILPTGAVLDSVTPYGSGGWNGPVGPNTGTVTLTGGPTSATVQPGWVWYGCYIHVHYPAPTFYDGETVTNNATLSFTTPCDQGQIETMNASASNTLCDPTPPPPPSSGGAIWKWLNLGTYFPSNPWYAPSWAPGCCGTYSIEYYNSGSTTQSSIVIDDTLDPTVDVGSITTYLWGGMTGVTVDVFTYSGTSCSTTPTASTTLSSSGTWTPGVGPICHIRWTYTGSLAPGNILYNLVDVCVRNNSYVSPYAPVVAGDHIRNTACVQGVNVPPNLCWTADNIVTATAPNILTAKFFEGKSGACSGCTPSTAGPFYPGDIIRWRMVIANVGSATATPCTITDMLPSGFTYQGGQTYYYGPLYWATSNNPNCCSMSGTVPAVIGGLTSPSVGDTTLTWSFPTLPADCSGTVNYLVIEFDAKADDNPTIAPGSYFNTFTFSAGNLGTPVTSNPAEVVINGYAGVQIFKDVRPNITGSSFSSTANVQPGGQAEYRLRVQNTGVLSLGNIFLLDIMPHLSDVFVLPPYLARGSAYNLPLSMAASAPAGYSTNYDGNTLTNSQNPNRTPLFCSSPASPGGATAYMSTSTFPAGGIYSFDFTGATATTIAPGGTQDFFFTTTVPSTTAVGIDACNTFGLQVIPHGTTTCLTTQSAAACVHTIPPDKNECDSIWGDLQFDDCCGFNITVLNTLGNVTELDYNVLPVGGGTTPSGVVQNITTSPCTPSSTVPGSLAGTTSGSLFYTPPCTSPLNAHVHASSTTASGEICIELIATLVQPDGTQIQCRDTVCFRCDPAPKDRCDSLGVKPYVKGNYSLRDFTIYNLKSPSSPICSVKITMTPTPSGLQGSGLIIDGTGHSWPAGSSSNWTWITSAHGLPGNSTVAFTLAVPYGSWSGTVTVTVYHCDGDSCTMRYGPWDATKGSTLGVGTSTDTPDRNTLHMGSLTFSTSAAADQHIRSISVQYTDPVSAIVAVTGATYPCDVDGSDQGNSNCNDLIEGVTVQDRSMMINLRRDLDDRSNTNDPIVTVVYSASSNDNPRAEIIYYDATGQEVGHDDVDVSGQDPPDRAVAGVGGSSTLASVMGALTARPNPTSGRCDVGFTIPSAAKVDLELVDARGNKVATVFTGQQMTAGEHHSIVDMSTLPSGTYLVSLRVNGVPSVLRMELAK